MPGHLLRCTDLLDKTILCCTCGRWLETVPVRLHEEQNDEKMKAMKDKWLQHVRLEAQAA